MEQHLMAKVWVEVCSPQLLFHNKNPYFVGLSTQNKRSAVNPIFDYFFDSSCAVLHPGTVRSP